MLNLIASFVLFLILRRRGLSGWRILWWLILLNLGIMAILLFAF